MPLLRRVGTERTKTEMTNYSETKPYERPLRDPTEDIARYDTDPRTVRWLEKAGFGGLVRADLADDRQGVDYWGWSEDFPDKDVIGIQTKTRKRNIFRREFDFEHEVLLETISNDVTHSPGNALTGKQDIDCYFVAVTDPVTNKGPWRIFLDHQKLIKAMPDLMSRYRETTPSQNPEYRTHNIPVPVSELEKLSVVLTFDKEWDPEA